MKYANFMMGVRGVTQRRLLLAFDPEDVQRNVKAFAEAVEKSPELQARLSSARAWYAIRSAKGWAFAPSKWAGYHNMTASQYLDANDGIDGRQTEKHLNRWFKFLPQDSGEHLNLLAELATFTARFGKQPSAAARISVIRSTPDEDAEGDDLVHLILRVIRKLDKRQQSLIRSALDA